MPLINYDQIELILCTTLHGWRFTHLTDPLLLSYLRMRRTLTLAKNYKHITPPRTIRAIAGTHYL